jgi:predicted nucleic acid-binding protein
MEMNTQKTPLGDIEMPKNSRVIYWDSCVFLSHINGIPDRIQTINSILYEINEDDNSIILTSSESIVEVAHALYEKENNQLDPKIESVIDAMWDDSRIVKMIDNGPHIAKIARNLIRDAIPQGWSLKSKDAIHLASAMWHNQFVRCIDEFHTYDKKLFKYEAMIGIHINTPHVLQYRMDFRKE